MEDSIEEDATQRQCATSDCTGEPPAGYGTCDECAFAQQLERELQPLRDQVADLQARLAYSSAGRRPKLAALLTRFGAGSRLGMSEVHDLRAGDVFAWPCAQIRAVTEADRHDYGQRTFEIDYTHDAEEALPAYEVHLVLRPGDPNRPCPECGRTFIEGCTEPCHERFITEDQIRAVFVESGMAALTEADPA